MDKTFIKSFYIAGFKYYEGAYIINQLKIGSKVKLFVDKKNNYDENAVELKYKGKKIGFIPKDDNREISILLKSGYKIFEAIIQQLSPEEHPERQVRIGVFVISK